MSQDETVSVMMISFRYLSRNQLELMEAFEHVTSWLKDLRAHADENVSIIRKSQLCLGGDGG